jgi:hypothetical protein
MSSDRVEVELGLGLGRLYEAEHKGENLLEKELNNIAHKSRKKK